MVNVTDRAKIVLKSALSRSVEEPGIGLRVEVSEEGACALFPDREKAGDQVVKHEGDVLLLIGEEVSQPLDGATIDLAETPEGAHPVVTKPDVPVDGTSCRRGFASRNRRRSPETTKLLCRSLAPWPIRALLAHRISRSGELITLLTRRSAPAPRLR